MTSVGDGQHYCVKYHQKRKGKDLTQYYDNILYTNRKFKKKRQNDVEHKKTTNMFDHTAIPDRLRAVSWDNDRYPTRVVQSV